MPYQWKGLRNYESFISSPPAIRTCLRDATSGGRASFYGGAHHFGRALLYRQMHESECNSSRHVVGGE